MINAYLAIVWVAKIALIPIIISSIEYLHSHQHLSDFGLMSWEVGRVRHRRFCIGLTGKFLHFFLSYPAVLGLLIARLIFALFILLLPFNWISNSLLFVLLAICEGLFVIRTPYGKDGSDQLTWITVIVLAITSLNPTQNVITVSLGFLAFQTILSYLTAGVAKASAVGWRNGTFITSITNMQAYGNSIIGKWMLKHKLFAVSCSWLIIVWECSFVLILFLPNVFVISFLISGFVFHFSNAAFMGLNCFFWAFLATYPAIYFIVNLLSTQWSF